MILIEHMSLPPINLYNYWIYNRYIRQYDDETIYKEYIDWKIEEYYDFQEYKNEHN